jgi:hypothetical protein
VITAIRDNEESATVVTMLETLGQPTKEKEGEDDKK